jgi:hypothetical protein
MNPQERAESECRQIYVEAQTFFEQLPRPRNYSFKILYAPPLYQPPILFIGYQPGGGDDDFERETARGSDKHWPATCEYATESWKLAKQMRQMFGRGFLEQCAGVNAIFLRSPTVADYKRNLDEHARARIEAFCLGRVIQIVEVFDPKAIVAIGFETLRLFGETTPDLANEKERVLTRIGTIAGRQAIGTLHLSGAHISKSDIDRIGDRVKRFRPALAAAIEAVAGTL